MADHTMAHSDSGSNLKPSPARPPPQEVTRRTDGKTLLLGVYFDEAWQWFDWYGNNAGSDKDDLNNFFWETSHWVCYKEGNYVVGFNGARSQGSLRWREEMNYEKKLRSIFICGGWGNVWNQSSNPKEFLKAPGQNVQGSTQIFWQYLQRAFGFWFSNLYSLHCPSCTPWKFNL